MGKEGKGIKSVMTHLLRLESAGEKGWSEDAGNGRKRKTLIPTFRRTAKIERQNTEESIGYDVTNRNIASLQCPILTPMTYGHERRKIGENGCPCSVLTWCESMKG